jgi:hypothetical protein
MAVGFFVWRGLRPPAQSDPTPEPATSTASTDPSLALLHQDQAPRADPEPEAKPEPTLATPPEGEPATVGFGRVLPFIDQSYGVDVGPEQGLLAVEYESSEPPPEVEVGGKGLGVAPVQLALEPGRHELVLRRGDRSSFRYLVIRTGETRVVEVD